MNRNFDIVQQLKSQIDDLGLWHKHLELKRHEFLTVKGSSDVNLYFIEKGSVRIFFEDDCEEQTIRLGYQYDFVGALDTLLSGRPSQLYIQAIKKCQFKVISKDSLKSLLNRKKENLQLWQSLLEALIIQQMEREIDILTTSPRARYNRVLRRSPRLFQEIPAKYIASYLRMTPETLSRLKKS